MPYVFDADVQITGHKWAVFHCACTTHLTLGFVRIAVSSIFVSGTRLADTSHMTAPSQSRFSRKHPEILNECTLQIWLTPNRGSANIAQPASWHVPLLQVLIHRGVYVYQCVRLVLPRAFFRGAIGWYLFHLQIWRIHVQFIKYNYQHNASYTG